jgi:hypothetical protein
MLDRSIRCYDLAVKNPHAVALGRLGGLKGGPARAQALSQTRRQTIGRHAAAARWQGGLPEHLRSLFSDLGDALEPFVFHELSTSIDTRHPGWELCYWRSTFAGPLARDQPAKVGRKATTLAA